MMDTSFDSNCDNYEDTDDEEFENSFEEEYCESSSDSEEHFEKKFEVLSLDKVMPAMVKVVREVQKVLYIPYNQVRLLLAKYKWDKDALLGEFCDTDRVKFLKKNGIPPSTCKPVHNEEFYSCEICVVVFSANEFVGVGCHHEFCSVCWSTYLETKMRDQGQFDKILCPGYGCNMLVDDETVLRLVTDAKLKQQYQIAITNSFVSCDKLMRWCVGKGCDKVVKVHRYESCKITCDCGACFCFACGEEWHHPAECHLVNAFKLQNTENLDKKWILVNTKDCPKCKWSIQKNGGCNHMTCRRDDCGYEFCWICLRKWDSIHGYDCNRYKENKEMKMCKSEIRMQLERYHHFYDRYKNHKVSLEAEREWQNTEMLLDVDCPWERLTIFRRAVDVLLECRRTLMFTFIFAYFLKPCNEREIFEKNQDVLHTSVEDLSYQLERITEDEAMNDRAAQDLQNSSIYCQSRCKKLLDHVTEGYEDDRWNYIEF